MTRITDIAINIELKSVGGTSSLYIQLANSLGIKYRTTPTTRWPGNRPTIPRRDERIDFTYDDRPIPGLSEQAFNILEIHPLVPAALQAQQASAASSQSAATATHHLTTMPSFAAASAATNSIVSAGKRQKPDGLSVHTSSSMSQAPLLAQGALTATASAASISASGTTIGSGGMMTKPLSSTALAGTTTIFPTPQSSVASHQAVSPTQATIPRTFTRIRGPSPVAAAAAPISPQWDIEEEDDEAFRRYSAFLEIIKENTWLLDQPHQQEYSNLLHQVAIDPRKSLYFSYNAADERIVSQFLQLFFIDSSRSQQNIISLKDCHDEKVRALGDNKCDVSCVSFLNITTHENSQPSSRCLVSVSGSGHYRFPGLYNLLKDFIEQEGARLTSLTGARYHLVDHTGRGNGPEAFHRLIRDVLGNIGKSQAQHFDKLCAEKGLVATLTKLIVQYGIYDLATNPNGIIIRSSFNVSFYPREINGGRFMAKSLPSALPIEVGNSFGKIQIKNDWFPLYECCPENCVRNKDAVKLILAVAIKERARLQGLLSPTRIKPTQ
ncbi:MAG: hypothetical protein K2Q14_01185 [Gammaproteobacteria bacterium]|nr:hypothetical protein [Gammaproteobacteria bacterium]